MEQLELVITVMQKTRLIREHYFQTSYTCVAVFINDGHGNYLIGERRTKTTLDGTTEYCIPGGKIDWKEEPEAAAVREVHDTKAGSYDPALAFISGQIYITN